MHLDAQPVQPGHGLETNVGLNVGGGAVMVDGQPHMSALGGEFLGDARAHPVAHPVIDHHPRAGRGAARQKVRGMNHLLRLAFKGRQLRP